MEGRNRFSYEDGKMVEEVIAAVKRVPGRRRQSSISLDVYFVFITWMLI